MKRSVTASLTSSAALALAFAAVAAGPASTASADSGRVFLSSAVEHADGTVTLPLHMGHSSGGDFAFVVIDASTSAAAKEFGVNRSDKLDHARGTAAVQQGRFVGGVLQVAATVDFAPVRSVPDGQPGSVGQPGYSPLVQLPDGTILDAPQIANATGQHDKVVSMNATSVRLQETEGRSRGNVVMYVSTDASKPAVAALEGSTLTPALDNAPGLGDDSSASSRASLAAFVNGQTGADNPQRQGINSALADGLSPLNILAWEPNQGRYSPLWDVHLAQWTDAAKAAGQDLRQSKFTDVEKLADQGLVTAAGGGTFGASDVVVLCPIISQH